MLIVNERHQSLRTRRLRTTLNLLQLRTSSWRSIDINIQEGEMLLQDGSKEFLRRSFWTEVFAEFLVTFLYLFLVCGAVLPWNNTPPPVIHIAFISGLSVATLVMAVLHISGGHLNPAVTISFMSVGRVSVLKAIFFIVAQCLGGRSHTGDSSKQPRKHSRSHCPCFYRKWLINVNPC